jgi:hypothetical protein
MTFEEGKFSTSDDGENGSESIRFVTYGRGSLHSRTITALIHTARSVGPRSYTSKCTLMPRWVPCEPELWTVCWVGAGGISCREAQHRCLVPGRGQRGRSP